MLDNPGDSANHGKLTLRESQGSITNAHILVPYLRKELKQSLDSKKPLVIYYYPGKNPCNSSGMATTRDKQRWHKYLQEGIEQIARTKPIHVYKDSERLDDLARMLTWHKDPDRTIERLFFKHHYPCNSFVVISEAGAFPL